MNILINTFDELAMFSSHDTQAGRGTGAKKAEKWDTRAIVSLVGGRGVGKSHLIHSYTNLRRFHRTYRPTIGVEFKTKIMKLDGSDIQLKIFDFSGACITDPNFSYQFLRYGNIPAGLVLAYDTTNQTSFNDVTGWYTQLKGQARVEIPAVLVGMKADMKAQRQVDPTQARDFSEKEGIPCSIEVSAHDKLGCEFVFATITSLISRKFPNIKDKVKSISAANDMPADKFR